MRNLLLRMIFMTILLLGITAISATVITIGTGTSYSNHTLPWCNWYGYMRCAQIYNAAEIGGTGTITTYAVKPQATNATANIPIKIYMKMTTARELSSSESYNSLATGATLVYTGTIASLTASTWNTVTLNTSFSYTGNNLLVITQSNVGGSGNYPYAAYYYSNAANQNWYNGVDYTPPTGGETNDNTNSNRVNIQLGITGYSVFPATDRTIGTGTAYEMGYEPWGSWYGYQRCAQIYASAEIGGTGIITKYAVKPHATISAAYIPIKIYMKMTTATELTSSETYNALTAGATLVYDGTIGSLTADIWNQVILGTSFNYTGNNLLVITESNIGGSGIYPWPTYYYTTAANKNWYFKVDMTPPTGGETTGTVNSDRVNIQLTMTGYTGFPPVFSVDPSSISWGNVLEHTTTSYIDVTVTNTGYNTLNITSVGLGGTDSARFILDMNSNPTPWALAAGAFKTVKVAFNPLAVTGYSAYLHFWGDTKVVHDIPLTGTGIPPVITTFPYLEGFEGAFPADGWANTALVGTFAWDQMSVGIDPVCSPHTGSYMVRYNSYSASNGSIATLATPSITLPGDNYEVSFWLYRDGVAYSANADEVEVYYNTVQSLDGASILGVVHRTIVMDPVVSAGGWYRYRFDFPSGSTGPNNYIILTGVSGFGNSLFLDDFVIQEQTVITYYPYIQSFDSAIFPPPGWVTVKTDGTGTPGTWDRQTTGANPSCSIFNGAGMVRFNSYAYAAGTKGILASPPLTLTANDYQVDFWYYRDSIDYSDLPDLVNVYFNTSQDLSGTPILLGTVHRSALLSPVVATDGWYHYTFNFPGSSAGVGKYVIFEGVSAWGNNIFLDHITIQKQPATLEAPAYLIAIRDGESIQLNWAEVSGATSYRIYTSIDPYASDWGLPFDEVYFGTSYVDALSAPGMFYKVTAVNGSKRESNFKHPLPAQEPANIRHRKTTLK